MPVSESVPNDTQTRLSNSGLRPAVDSSFDEWLSGQVVRNEKAFRGKPLLLDVGAYRGDFASKFLGLKNTPFQKAVLFEPNPDCFRMLEGVFASDSRYSVQRVACDSESNPRTLFCRGEKYTGSLLHYATEEGGFSTDETLVRCLRLDDYLTSSSDRAQVGLIKVDTQGNDLRVLQGAEEILRTSRPWLAVELIFIPLYKGQADPQELTRWLGSQGYTLAGQFNEYYTSDGWLAWEDACFIPKEVPRSAAMDFVRRPVLVDAYQVSAPKRRQFLRSIFKRQASHGGN